MLPPCVGGSAADIQVAGAGLAVVPGTPLAIALYRSIIVLNIEGCRHRHSGIQHLSQTKEHSGTRLVPASGSVLILVLD
jgi:hypothetical protein